MKKTLAIILSVLMLLSVFSIMTTAETDASATNAIEINSAEDFANIPTTGLDKNYILMQDITITDANYAPIGDYTNRFKGTFDGNNKTITVDLTYNNTSYAAKAAMSDVKYVGLFGVIEGATIKNLTVAGEMDVTTNLSVIGSIVGGSFGAATLTKVVSDVDMTISLNSGGSTDATQIGGVVGAFFTKEGSSTSVDVTLTDVANKGDVDVTNANATETNTAFADFLASGQGGFGGIAGHSDEKINISFTRCVNYGDLSIDNGHHNMAGILGYQAYTKTSGKSLTMKYCANHGNITRTTRRLERVATLYGCARYGIYIENSFNTGVLSDTTTTHGIGFLGTGSVDKNYAANYFTITPVGTFFDRGTSTYVATSKCVNNFTVADTGTVKLGTKIGVTSEDNIEDIYDAVKVAYAGKEMADLIELGVIDGKASIYFTFENADEYVKEGGEVDPMDMPAIEIDTAEKFAKIGVDANYPANRKYILTENITITSDNYAPVGTFAAPFTGEFDGNGKTITVDIAYTNLNTTNTIAGCANVGVFGVIEKATIKNLTVEGTMDVTTICGYIGALVGASYGNSKLLDCETDVDLTITLDAAAKSDLATPYQYPSFIGGMIGAFHQDQDSLGSSMATIENCTNLGNITVTTGIDSATAPSGEAAYQMATKGGYGGVVGVVGINNAKTLGVQLVMTSCFNYGDMLINQGPQNIGGLVGMTACASTPKLTISYSANYGDITRQAAWTDRVCGIFGYTRFAEVSYSFNAGKLSDTGAINADGTQEKPNPTCLLGFIGSGGDCVANYCFTTTPVDNFFANEGRATDTTTNYPLSGMAGLNGSTAIGASNTSSGDEIANALLAAFAADENAAKTFKIYGIYDSVNDKGINVGFADTPKGVSYYGYQTTDVADGAYNVRFVALVDKLSYDAIGYDIKGTFFDAEQNKTRTFIWNKACETVYTSLTANIAGTEGVYEVVGNYYIMALAITGVPANVGEITFEVTPYSMDGGVKTPGETVTVVVNPTAE